MFMLKCAIFSSLAEIWKCVAFSVYLIFIFDSFRMKFCDDSIYMGCFADMFNILRET